MKYYISNVVAWVGDSVQVGAPEVMTVRIAPEGAQQLK